MRYVVFSDLHGNQYALKQLLKKFVDNNEEKRWIFLGDIMGYFYGQEESIGLLKELDNLTALKGNHDQYYLEALDKCDMMEKYVELYGSSYNSMLSDGSMEFLNNMLLKKEILVDSKKILCFHGGVRDFLSERVYPDKVIRYYEENKEELNKYDYILSGHTHYRLDIKLSNSLRWINPGSLGQPRDNNGFSYAVIDFGKDEVQFNEVKCDISMIKQEIEDYETSERNKTYLLKKLQGES